MWDTILQCFNTRYNADIRQAFLTKEIYTDLYEKHDLTKLFYPEQYSVSVLNTETLTNRDDSFLYRKCLLQNSVEDTVYCANKILNLFMLNKANTIDFENHVDFSTVEQITEQDIPKPDYPGQHSCRHKIYLDSIYIEIFWIAQI